MEPVAHGEDADVGPAPSDPEKVSEFEVALKTGRVPFSLVTSAFYGAGDGSDPDRETAVFERYYARLREVYETDSGGVRETWFGGPHGSAAALTEDGELTIMLPSAILDLEARQLSDECERLNLEAQRTCFPSDASACAMDAFDTATHILEYLGRVDRKTVEDRDAELEDLRRRVRDVAASVGTAGQRAAQLRYFGGTAIGIAVVAVLAAACGAAARAWTVGSVDIQLLVVTMVAGGLGAWVSVLYRFSFRKVTLDVSADPAQLRWLGVVRPLIGSILALAVYCLMGSGLLPMDLPEEREQLVLFVAFFGFLSGFSERWAQDMLVVGEERLRTGVAGPEGQTPPGAAPGGPTAAG